MAINWGNTFDLGKLHWVVFRVAGISRLVGDMRQEGLMTKESHSTETTLDSVWLSLNSRANSECHNLEILFLRFSEASFQQSPLSFF